jgi:O-antigen ligase
VSAEAPTVIAGLRPAQALRERRLLAVARFSAAVALIGAFTSPPLANLAALTLLLSFALLPSARQRLRAALAPPLVRAALLLLAALAVAMLWSEAPLVMRWRAWFDWRPLLLLILCLAVVDRTTRARALLAFVAAACLGAIYSFWAWAHGYSTVTHDHGLPGIVLRNPVTQGLAFALACFFALALAAGARHLDRRLRLALAAASLLLLANLVLVTSGRSGHLLLLILLGVAALQLLRGWRRAAVIAALPLLAAVAVAASPMLQARFGLLLQEMRAPLASEQLTAMGIRAVMWRVSAQMARERPLLGYGMGGFPAAYERAIGQSSYTGWAATPTVDPHNQYLQVHLQAGVLGSVAFLWFLIAAFRQPGRQPYRAWASAVLAGWCATSLFTSHFTTFAEAHLVMLLLGILLAGADEPATPPAPAEAAAVAAGGVTAARLAQCRRAIRRAASLPLR